MSTHKSEIYVCDIKGYPYCKSEASLTIKISTYNFVSSSRVNKTNRM